jgi:glycosyltransferase involved in cell wall biosynthesis
LKYFVRVSGPDIPGFEHRYRFLYPVLSPIIRKIWHRAIITVAKCKGEAEMIYKVSRQVEIDLIPNGVDLDVFQPGDPIPDEGALRLICVARLIERKGQHHLIRVIESLQQQGLDLELELVGTGDEEGKYKDLAKQLGISDRVKFLGYVPRQDIPALYRKAHVFVLPSFNEGMSVSTLEAMASGLPVVVTNTGGTEELVHDRVNGYVFEWGDTEALSIHLKNLAQDRQSARKMGVASRKQAEQFSWPGAANRYFALFDCLLSSRVDTPATRI